MVQDQFSRPLFSYGSAFWVYRGSVSVEQRHCLCGTDTVSVWDTHSVSVWDTHSPGGGAGGFAGNSNPTLGLPSPPHTHTPKIAIPQLRGDETDARAKDEAVPAWLDMASWGAQSGLNDRTNLTLSMVRQFYLSGPSGHSLLPYPWCFV